MIRQVGPVETDCSTTTTPAGIVRVDGLLPGVACPPMRPCQGAEEVFRRLRSQACSVRCHVPSRPVDVALS